MEWFHKVWDIYVRSLKEISSIRELNQQGMVEGKYKIVVVSTIHLPGDSCVMLYLYGGLLKLG